FDEDVVIRQEGVILRDARLKVVEELGAMTNPVVGQIIMNAADGDVTVRQARAANFLEKVEDHFPFAEGIQEWAERAKIQTVGPHRDEMARDSVQLADDDADNLCF